MNQKQTTQTTTLYRLRQQELLERKRQVRRLKRWGVSLLVIDTFLFIGYLVAKDEVVFFLHTFWSPSALP